MKIVFDLIGFEHGKAYGFEEYILNLLSGISKFRNRLLANEVIVVCHKNQIKYIQPRVDKDVCIVDVEYSGFLGRLIKSSRLSKILNLTKEDIVFYPGNTMPIFAGKTKKILVLHDLITFHPEFCSNSIRFKLYRLHKYIYIPQSIRKADRIIAISRFTKEEILNRFHIDPSKISVIYNSFDFQKYGDYQEKNGIIDGRYILTVCSAVKHKNHITTLMAFNDLAKSVPDVKLVIVGSLNPSCLKYFENLPCHIKNRIILLKNLSNEELAVIYSKAIAYVSSSLYEGLGMPVVEALYFDLPTCVSDIAIHREVTFNKALYFRPNDSTELYNEFLAILNKQVSKPNQKDLIIQRYCLETVSLQYIKVINDIAKSK